MTVAALSAILAQRSIHSLFQPIMCLSEQRVFGHEALSHGPSNNSLHAPLNLFSIARQAGRLTEMEAALLLTIRLFRGSCTRTPGPPRRHAMRPPPCHRPARQTAPAVRHIQRSRYAVIGWRPG